MGLQAEIWARRLGEGGAEEEEKKKEEEEKFPLCESIGHRTHRGRCPKTSHPRIAHGQRYPMPCLG